MKRAIGTSATSAGITSEHRRKVFLHPGRVFATKQPTDVTTILGSCVSACVWDAETRAGAACHFVLPHGAAEGSGALRHANVAIHEVIEQLTDLGADIRRLRAKLFGGANVVPGIRENGETLGTRNVQAADKCLAAAGVPVVARDVGGQRARKLIFQTDDGTVWVKTI